MAAVPSCLVAQGLTPVWQLEKNLTALVQQTRRLLPVMDEIKPENWNGAPEAYRQQYASARAEVGYLARSAAELAATPEKLPVALETYLRLQAIESMLDSLSQGVRRYQNPALADLLQGVISENDVHRDRLRGYLVELAGTKETELRIASEEAQRCRAGLIRPQPPRPPARKPANNGAGAAAPPPASGKKP